MRSLRFRIPAIFLIGVLVAGAVTAVFAIRFFQDYTQDRSVAELRRQAAGLARLYEEQAIRSLDEAKQVPGFAAPLLEEATGSRLYYSGISPFPGEGSGLRTLDRSYLDWGMLERGSVETFEFVPPGADHTYLAAAHPITIDGNMFGALIIAKPRADLQSRWLYLLGRMGMAVAAGLIEVVHRPDDLALGPLHGAEVAQVRVAGDQHGGARAPEHQVLVGAAHVEVEQARVGAKEARVRRGLEGEAPREDARDNARSEAEPTPVLARPTPPTHVVYGGLAYRVGAAGLAIGREADPQRRTIVLTGSNGVSRLHCEVVLRDGELKLRDLSSYGTFVNERKVAGETTLSRADVIRIGSPGAELHVVDVEDA